MALGAGGGRTATIVDSTVRVSEDDTENYGVGAIVAAE